MAAFKVVAVGDSSMWGQGLDRSDTYALRSAKRLAEFFRRDLDFQNLARSGAKLEAKSDKTKANVFRLRSGKVVPTFSGDRHTFADRFPELFKTDKDAEDFLDETVNVQEPARTLFGDIPATFPTITAQIRSVSDEDGKNTHVLIMNGGVNDVDYEAVLNPDGDPLEIIERNIKGAMFVKLKLALKRARRKFPHAVIIYVGYFTPFSKGSDPKRLERMFKYFAGLPGWKLIVNDFVESSLGSLTPIGLIVDFFVDTAEEKVRDSIKRSVFAHEKSLEFIKKAIADTVADLGADDAGIVLADPAFKSENSIFGSASMLFEGYHPPEKKDIPPTQGIPFGTPGIKFERVEDALLKERVQKFPRIGLVSRLEKLSESLKDLLSLDATLEALARQQGRPANKFALNKKNEELQPAIRGLRHDVDGPQSLRELLNTIANGDFNKDAVKLAVTALDKEAAILRVAQIASVLHPNEAGARHYADVIVRTYNAHKGIKQ